MVLKLSTHQGIKMRKKCLKEFKQYLLSNVCILSDAEESREVREHENVKCVPFPWASERTQRRTDVLQ